MNEIIPLGKSHDNVAPVGAERISHEAGGLRIPREGEPLPKLFGEARSQLVFEALALLVGEGEVVRIWMALISVILMKGAWR